MRNTEDTDALERLSRLRDRPTPELDTNQAWRRLHATLRATPQPRGIGWLVVPAWRVGLAAAMVAAAAAALWMAPGSDPAVAPDRGSVAAGDASTAPESSREMVLLAEPEEAALAAMVPSAQDAVPADSYTLEFRLVRGYTGSRPADALDEAVRGAGGASLRADLDPTLRALHPDREHAIIGLWSGEITDASATVGLSAEYDLRFGIDRTAEGVRLLHVELHGAEPPLVAQEMLLSPGQLYIFGVRGSDATPSDLVLAVRLRPAAAPDGPQD